MIIKLNFRLIEFTILQFAIVTIIIIFGLSYYLLIYTAGITGPRFLLEFLRLLDVDSEQSFPTYFSLLNLLLSSLLLFIIYKYEKANNNKRFNYWIFLSILFLFLSIDESASVHENFVYVYKYFERKEILPHVLDTHQWLPFGIFFILIIGICLIPFYKTLSKITLYYFIISGLIFLIGAIGFEFIGALMLKTGFVDSRESILYATRRLFEEGFEMYGVALFNCALYREILNRKISLTLFSS